jgi:hypothetical protein
MLTYNSPYLPGDHAISSHLRIPTCHSQRADLSVIVSSAMISISWSELSLGVEAPSVKAILVKEMHLGIFPWIPQIHRHSRGAGVVTDVIPYKDVVIHSSLPKLPFFPRCEPFALRAL